MPREASPDRKRAFEIYEQNNGNIKLRDIAQELGISEKSISGWKSKDAWDKKLNGVVQNNTEYSKQNTEYSERNKSKKLHKNGEEKKSIRKEVEVAESLELSDKERVFAENYVRHKNKTLAAIQAGYPKSTAHVQGSRLYKKRKVFDYIQSLREESKSEILFGVNELVDYHMKVACADLGDFVTWGSKEVKVRGKNGEVIDEETGEAITKTINRISFKDSDTIDTSVITEVKLGKDGVSVKLADKKYSMQWLTDFFQWNPMDKHKVDYDNARLAMQRSKLEEEQETTNYSYAEQFFLLMSKLYRHKPVEFCQAVLNFEPDDWQKKVLNDIAKYPKVSVRSAQGVGKTGIEACVLLWFLACFPYPRIIATAPTRQQLNDVLWSEISKWQNKSEDLKELLVWTKTKIYRTDDSERCFAVAKTATKAENMQGFHEDNMLFIVDEASGVADPIMEAILGTLSGENNKLLMCGNPTRKSGAFHDSHTVDKEIYKTHKISAFDSSRTNKENIASLISKFGEHSNVVRVRVHGEFPIDEDDVFIPTALAESSIHTEKNIEVIETIDIGVDVARHGSDSTVIAVKLNNTVQPLIVRHGQDLMATANQVFATANELYARYRKNIMIKVDDTGLGGGVTDRLSQLKYEQSSSWMLIVPINMAKSVKHSYYDNITTVMWGRLKEMLEAGELSLPNDPILIGELTNRKKAYSSNGKIILERKDDMKKRGLPSPDRADAMTLATYFIDTNKNVRREGGDKTRA